MSGIGNKDGAPDNKPDEEKKADQSDSPPPPSGKPIEEGGDGWDTTLG